MNTPEDRITLIDDLASFPGLADEEVELLEIALSNANHLKNPSTLEEHIDSTVAFNEIGFRLDRLQRRIAGSNVEVFNPPQMKVRGPRMAKPRALA
ncbi:MAG: hypothetical protein QGI09_02325 [Dehalococcoidia bacterium]|jgi:hypothetical protein|nr:hypothetical protein [Dehalococcoidia bacterium]